jgi:hypothetical protein
MGKVETSGDFRRWVTARRTRLCHPRAVYRRLSRTVMYLLRRILV